MTKHPSEIEFESICTQVTDLRQYKLADTIQEDQIDAIITQTMQCID